MALATARGLQHGRKRKREDGLSRASKKSRTAVVDSPHKVDFQDQALQLEEEIFESRKNYNKIHTLLKHLKGTDGVDGDDVVAAVALCRVFCRLMAAGNLGKLRESYGNDVTIVQWLKERLQDYEQGLLQMLGNEDNNKQSIALNIIVRLVKEKALHMNQSEDAFWQKGLFRKLVQTLIKGEVAAETITEFVEKYVERYGDVRYYTFACLAYVRSPP